MPLKKKLYFSIVPPPQDSKSNAQVSLALFPNFTQNLMLICCSKNRSLILATRRRNTLTSYQRHNFHTTGVNAMKS